MMPQELWHLPEAWPGVDGEPVSCRDKVRVLVANHKELAGVMQDAFEDALVIGVDEAAMRQILIDLVAQMRPPRTLP